MTCWRTLAPAHWCADTLCSHKHAHMLPPFADNVVTPTQLLAHGCSVTLNDDAVPVTDLCRLPTLTLSFLLPRNRQDSLWGEVILLVSSGAQAHRCSGGGRGRGWSAPGAISEGVTRRQPTRDLPCHPGCELPPSCRRRIRKILHLQLHPPPPSVRHAHMRGT